MAYIWRGRHTRSGTILFSIALVAVSGLFMRAQAGSEKSERNTALRYSLPFGNDPFLPSRAMTVSGKFIAASEFPSASYCGTCHQDIHAQWRESAHANSFREPFYRKNVDLLIAQKGIEFTRHCEGCHNPIALLSGALTTASTADRSFDQDGITCMVCHSIQRIQNTGGTGSYVMGVPSVMLSADGTPRIGKVSFDEILQHPELHRRAVMRDFYRTPEFCSACHKASIPRMLNDYKWLRAFSVYDEWQQSSWSRETPLPFYKKQTQSTCQSCHMPRVAALSDYGAKNHTIASHRWPAANTAIPFFYRYPEQMQATENLLKDSLAIDIFALTKRESGRERLIAPLDLAGFSLLGGETVTADVVIQNKKIGHNLVPEQRDFYECWVEFTAADGSGKEFYHSGALRPDGFLEGSAHSYTNRLISSDGKLLDLHQVWNTKAKPYDNTIPAGASDLVRFRFRIPTLTKGPIVLTAKVNYRRFRRGFTNFVLGESVDYPVAQLGSRSVFLKIGRTAAKHAASKKEQMKRWNNYGIALLRQQQYWRAGDAFRRVAALDPGNADAYINLAIAGYSKLVDTRVGPDGAGNLSLANSDFSGYQTALKDLEQALHLRPGDARALFYRGLIFRLENNLDAALRDLKAVVGNYPRFRQARQELAYTYYLLSQYKQAQFEFEALQGINPDDLTAHYYLSLIYRRLGMLDAATREATLFAEHKDDGGAALLALRFRYKHPEVAHENEPYHVHEQSVMQVK